MASLIADIADKLVSVYMHRAFSEQRGVVTLGGEWLFPLTEKVQGIGLKTSEKTGKSYAFISRYDLENGQSYNVIDEEGRTLFSGEGRADFLPDMDLVTLDGPTEFAYTDPEGNYVFRMKYPE
jgi:hypothetical protein